MISKLLPDSSGTFLNSIYKSKYLVFNLFILDYFGLFNFGFRLSVHLDLTSKSGDQKLL